MDKFMRRTAAALTGVFLAGSVLTGCGNETDDSDGSQDKADEVTVTHSMGETKVPKDPETVISVSTAFTDAFSALGSPVTLEARASQMGDDAPWRGDTEPAEDVTVYDGGSDTMVQDFAEEFAALDPDVIFAGWLPDEEAYDTLSDVAPTVAVVGDNTQSDDWRIATALSGEILGEEDNATSLIEDTETALSDTTDKFPGLDGATGVFGQASAQGTAVVTADNDPANRFLSDLGMVVPEEVKEASDDGSRAYISEENISLLDTDFLAMWPLGVQPDTLSGWDDLTSVKNDSVYIADQAAAMALSTPTVLSVPWSLEQLEPNLKSVNDAADA
jgi:iron complex transport system substrate-binding protein